MGTERRHDECGHRTAAQAGGSAWNGGAYRKCWAWAGEGRNPPSARAARLARKDWLGAVASAQPPESVRTKPESLIGLTLADVLRRGRTAIQSSKEFVPEANESLAETMCRATGLSMGELRAALLRPGQRAPGLNTYRYSLLSGLVWPQRSSDVRRACDPQTQSLQAPALQNHKCRKRARTPLTTKSRRQNGIVRMPLFALSMVRAIQSTPYFAPCGLIVRTIS